jgi:branched-chain amino acid transport system permease protein
MGYTGLLSIAHAAFFGIGAYVTGLMALRLGSPFLINLLCASVISGLLGGLVGIPSLRIRDDVFVIATFAFQVIVFSILNNWTSYTGGPMGLPSIPKPAILGWHVSSHYEFLLLVGGLAAVIVRGCSCIVNSPFGRVLMAIREDEVFSKASGKNVAAYKISIFIVGSALAAIAGVLYAYYISFIDPTSFTVMESIFIISVVIIGGAGTLWGPVVGAVILVILPELLRFIGFPGSLLANIRQILYGGLLAVFILWRPHGLMGKYGFKMGTAKK